MKAAPWIIVLLLRMAVMARGYDGYTSCPRQLRTSKSWPEPPCDFRSQTWCIIPGSAYPWHAVRRFVYENQGLMRRMYGDQRHISVLRAEIENNDVEEHHRDEARHRYTGGRGRSSSTTTSPTTPTTTTPVTSTITSPITSTTAASVVQLRAAQPSFVPKAKNSTKAYSNSADPTFNETVDKTPSTSSPNTTTTSTSTPPPTTTGQTLDEPTTLMTDTATTTTTTTSFTEPFDHTTDTVTTEEPPQRKTMPALFKEKLAPSQLFQAEAEERMPSVRVPVKMKGVNACPVKEEVVAPFWANSTRGEILALLNLYPFEQYVHWEKCTYEHKQMYCREGCRCEQQYRLHRLLAYDPKNECRGIFADWFKFPSCCVCKCYDLPVEFQITSRSPRVHQSHPWYRVSDAR